MIPSQFYRDLEKNGIILVGSHYGLFETSYSTLNKFPPYICHLPYKSLQGKEKERINDYLFNNDFYKRVQFIKIKRGETFKKLLKIKKGIILLGCDQRPPLNANIAVTFLNQPALPFHIGAGLLKLKTKRKIWGICYFYNEYTKRIHIKIYKIPILKGMGLKEISQEIANSFSYNIINNPEQYMWCHNRFDL